MTARIYRSAARRAACALLASFLAAGSLQAQSSVRIDPAQGSILARINVGNGAAALAASDQAVWVANRLDGTVSRIDPA